MSQTVVKIHTQVCEIVRMYMSEKLSDFDFSDPFEYLELAADGCQWMCMLCGKYTAEKGNAKRHVKYVHMRVSEEVDCPYCKKVYARKQVLDRHLKYCHFTE